MTLQVKHSFQSTKSDGADSSLVRPSNWNAVHDFTCAPYVVLGRNAAGTGAVGEIAFADLPAALGVTTWIGEMTIQKDNPSIALEDVGTTGPIQLRNNIQRFGFYRPSNSTWLAYSDLSGSANFTIHGSNYFTGSDRRVKTDIATVQDALALVGRMRGVFFKRTDTGDDSVGVIAQEMQEVVPQVVGANEDGMLHVSYGNLVGVLIEAIKELTQRVEALEGKA